MHSGMTLSMKKKKWLTISPHLADGIAEMGRPLRFIDLFAGIGGFRLGFERAGLQCVFSSEWDHFARASYKANFGDEPDGDIRKIPSEAIPDFDVLTAGFPCQPFSIAGVSKKNALGRKHGFADETQGTLFFEVARIIAHHRPEAFVLENVKNLVSHDGGRTFQVILKTLTEELGYRVDYSVLSSRYYVPQNRQRIFIVGFKSASALQRFRFPGNVSAIAGQPLEIHPPLPSMGDILEKKIDIRYTLSDKLWSYLQDYKEKHRRAGHGFGFGLIDPRGQARTLSARYYKDGSEILVPQRKSKANPGANPRRLTPRECARLMGFPEDYRIVVSDTQAYKQFGNAVVVPVVSEVAKAVKKALALATKDVAKEQSRVDTIHGRKKEGKEGLEKATG